MSPSVHWQPLGQTLIGQAETLHGLPRVRHAFTSRQGGVSLGPYASLNLAIRPDDDRPDHVRANRALLATALGLDADRLVTADQVHGANVQVVDRPGMHVPATDALVTTIPNVPLLILVADCLPVVIADERGRAVAAVHAGWRGVAGGIAVKAAETVANLADCPLDELHVGIGPSIGPCCFGVHEDVTGPLTAAVPEGPVPVWRDGQPFVDLGATLEAQLQSAGLNRIGRDPTCTRCHPDQFYSYRRERGTTGRQGVLAWLAGGDA